MSSHYRASSSLRHVVFGTPSNNDALTIRFGCQQGVFERLGIDLELKTLFGGPALDIPGLELALQMMHELGGIDRRVTVDSFCDFRFQ